MATQTSDQKDYYCLGGTLFNDCCNSCLWLKNWNELNDLEYDDRHEIQDKMHQIDSMTCRLTKMGLYKKSEGVVQ